jgi:hypothetical protein
MPMTVLTMLVSRRRMLLGLIVLPVGVMLSRLQVMVRSGVMVCGGLTVMLDGRVFRWFCHGLALLQGFGEHRHTAPNDAPHSAR